MEAVRKRNPRAPSIHLEEAIERALAAYDKDQLRPAPTETVAQNLGYKSANNGRALGAIASLRYFGLLDRPKVGVLAVSKALETYKLTPKAARRRELLINFLLGPPLFKALLALYKTALPSDAAIRNELVRQGFMPGPAETCVAVFRKSVEFAGYFRAPSADDLADAKPPDPSPNQPLSTPVHVDAIVEGSHGLASKARPRPGPAQRQPPTRPQPVVAPALPSVAAGQGDSIPIRLSGGRRAWLIVPEQLFEADKVRLKAQIDLLLTVEQERSLE